MYNGYEYLFTFLFIPALTQDHALFAQNYETLAIWKESLYHHILRKGRIDNDNLQCQITHR